MILGKVRKYILRWYYTPNTKLACFVLYLKLSTHLKIIIIIIIIIYASYNKLFKELKSGIEILVDQVVLELLIKPIV